MDLKALHLTSVHRWDDVRVLRKECVSLADHGHQVTLVAPAPFAERTVQGVRVIGLPVVPRWQRPRLWRRIATLCRQMRPDILHFHDPELIPVLMPLARRLGTPLVYDCHEYYPDDIRSKPWIPRPLRGLVGAAYDWYELRSAGRFDAVITADPSVAARFERRQHVVVLHNYPLRSTIDYADEHAHCGSRQGITVAYLGGITLDRGLWVMLKAAATVCACTPEVRFRFLGPFCDPALEAPARRLCERHDALRSRVEFTGRVPYEQALRELSEADIGWIPWLDCLRHRMIVPTKAFEYMSFGLALVASDLPPIRHYVASERCGLLVPAGDAERHANAIVKLSGDADERQAMGERGRTGVRVRYTWQNEKAKLLHLYGTLSASARSSAS